MRNGRERTVRQKLRAKKRAWSRAPNGPPTGHRVIHGDARAMRGLEDESIHLVVTSPPYWNLKEYAPNRRQLGRISDYRRFLDNLDRVWAECLRTLVPGGRVCVVVGDVCQSRKKHGRHRVVPLHADILRRCDDLGFEPLAPIIWHKIANASLEANGRGAFLGKPYEPNAIIKNDIEFILLLRKPGYRHPTRAQRDLSVIDPSDHKKWYRQVWAGVPGASTRHHPAPFPSEIPRRLISMFSFVSDTVLDPFVGTGTTLAAAKSLSRSSIGYDIEEMYCRLAKKALKEKK